MNIDTSKIIDREKLSGFKGGAEEYYCCRLVCFEQQWSCDQTGTDDCNTVDLPDESCSVERIDCDGC
jgi:hypothetical protein